MTAFVLCVLWLASWNLLHEHEIVPPISTGNQIFLVALSGLWTISGVVARIKELAR